MASQHSQPPAAVPPHCVVILDAGAQYSKVIDRRVRELQVECHIKPLSTPVAELQPYAAIIISGGPQSVYGSDAPQYDPALFTEYRKPILGICYGMQLINHVCGGAIARGGTREDGQFHIRLETQPPSLLYADLPDEIEVLLTHGDSITAVAPDFRATAHSPAGIVASIECAERAIYGVQYHPEVDLTPQGSTILRNFLEHVCRLPRDFTLASRQHAAIDEIRTTVGDKAKVLCLLSGGVDSSVCAALLKEAIGPERIIAIHIDNGFMRLDESARVVSALRAIGLHIHLVDARERFYHGRTMIRDVETPELCATCVPEEKRKIIGDTFMRCSEEELRKFGLKPEEVFLAQGTLRPDLIESASTLASVGGTADVIKTHHNDTALVRALRAQGRIIEPLASLHKDEVRLLGRDLGLPEHLIWRQPFPGPGLAVRIICATEPFVTGHEAQIQAALAGYATQAIAVSLVACRTVGVQGDSRSYSSLVALSSTSSARPEDLAPNWHSLFHLAREIPKRVHGVNRVVYVFGAPLKQRYYGRITKTLLTPDVIHQLQQADEIVNQILLEYRLVKTLSQVPVILFPINFSDTNEDDGRRSICIRTFITNDFMTGVPALPAVDDLHNVAQAASSPSPPPSSENGVAASPSDSPTVATADSYSTPEHLPITALQPPCEPSEVPHVDTDASAALIAASDPHERPADVPVSNVRFPTMPLRALQTMVRRIMAEVPGIARVVFDLTSKPPATTEWE